MQETEFKINGAKITALPEFARELRRVSFDLRQLDGETNEFLKRRRIPQSLREYLDKRRRSTFTSEGANKVYKEDRRMYIASTAGGRTFLIREAGATPASYQHELLKHLYEAGVHALKPVGFVTIEGKQFIISNFQKKHETVADYLHWLNTSGPKSQAAKRKRRLALARVLGVTVRQAHETGILHRDLHPWNILIKRDKKGFATNLKLIDLEFSQKTTVGPRRSRVDLGKLAEKTIEHFGSISDEEKKAFLTAYRKRLAKAFERLRRIRALRKAEQ